MKQINNLVEADFKRRPAWIGVHNFDSGAPWYEDSDEETYRPWTGSLPFSSDRGILLVATTFQLADGSVYPGYSSAVPENWDVPLPPRTLRDGTQTNPQSWSQLHGGTKLSILGLQQPTIFINGRTCNFSLRPKERKHTLAEFYVAFQREPRDIFPVHFHADATLTTRICDGQLDGLFSFPLREKSFEIDTGETVLNKAGGALNLLAILQEMRDGWSLTVDDFERHPLWVHVGDFDREESWYEWSGKQSYRPWTGGFPVAPERGRLLVRTRFEMHDGGVYRGYIRPVSEGWPDLIPPPTTLLGKIWQTNAPRVAYEGLPLPWISVQRPTIFVKGRSYRFWASAEGSASAKRRAFYEFVGKQPDAIFPIHFQADLGFVTGIQDGSADGFYRKPLWPNALR